MGQKTIWMHYLIIGISLFLIACSTQTEYTNLANFRFSNNTSDNLFFQVISDSRLTDVNLESHSKSQLLTVTLEGPKYVEKESYLINLSPSGGLEPNFYITVNDTLCVTHKSSGSAIIDNYTEYDNLFTYTFTEKDFENKVKCAQ